MLALVTSGGVMMGNFYFSFLYIFHAFQTFFTMYVIFKLENRTYWEVKIKQTLPYNSSK